MVAIILIIAAILLVANTIRLSAFNRRRETAIMRLVGASNFYVQLPFLVEGMIAGLFGWLVAVALLAGAKAGLDGLQNYFPFHAQLSISDLIEVVRRDHVHRPAALRDDLVPHAQALPTSLRGQTYTVAATQGKKAQRPGKSQQGRKLVASNRRARHDYTIEDVVEAGIMLTGTEVKSLRAGRATLSEGYGLITDGEVWLHGVHIPQYVQGTWTNHEPRRVRKLLLHRKEIDRLARSTAEGGLTLVPLSLYFSDGKAKIELALARGRRTYDKRQELARRDATREVERAMRRRR